MLALAIPVLERAEAAGYNGADMHIAWGHGLMVQEKPDEALLRYRKAVAIDAATTAEVPPDLPGKL